MLIGEIVRQSGVSRDTIRYYERLGLLRTQGYSASSNTYKAYASDTLARLELIRRGKILGFSLTEIADGLELIFNEQLSDGEVKDMLEEKAQRIDQKIEALQVMRQHLTFSLEQVYAGQCSLQRLRAKGLLTNQS